MVYILCHKSRESLGWNAVKRFIRQSFLQSKPLWGNKTVLYASVVSQICHVRWARNLWSETLSSAIYVSQIHLTSGIWDRRLIYSFGIITNCFVWSKWILMSKVWKQYGCTDCQIFIWHLTKCFAAIMWPNVLIINVLRDKLLIGNIK